MLQFRQLPSTPARPAYALIGEHGAVVWSMRGKFSEITWHYPEAAFRSPGYPCELLDAGRCHEQYSALIGDALAAYGSCDIEAIRQGMTGDYAVLRLVVEQSRQPQ